MLTFDKYELGRTDDTVEISLRNENRAAALTMARQSRRTLEILSRKLDPDIYDTIEFVEAVKAFILQNRRSRVRILVDDAKSLVQQGHRLINLSYSLSSYIEFRIPSEDYKDHTDSLFIADTTGYIHRLNENRFEGTLNFNDQRVSKHLLHSFDEVWSRASQDLNLRQVHI